MKVLVIKIAAIGDFLMATPVLRVMKNDPEIEALLLLAGNSIRPVVEGTRLADKVIFLDDQRLFHGSWLSRVREMWRVCRILRQERIDVGFNFHRDWRYNCILFLARIPVRVGFASRFSPLLTNTVRVDGVLHHVFHYCRQLRVIGRTCLDYTMEFPIAAAVEAEVEKRFLSPLNLADYVALAPGGAVNVKEEMATRRWGKERFAALAGLLIESGRKVILVGSIADCAIGRFIRRQHAAVIDFCGETSLLEAAVLLKKARLVVSNDSGLMHLAEAVGALVIALFGPTHPDEKRPLSRGNVVVWKGNELPCSPCYHDGRFPACDHLTCWQRIQPEEVFQLIESMRPPS